MNGSAQRECVDVALFARRRPPGELARPRRGLSRRRHVGVEEEASREGNVREGEGRVGLYRAAQVLPKPGVRGQQAFSASDVGVIAVDPGRWTGPPEVAASKQSVPAT